MVAFHHGERNGLTLANRDVDFSKGFELSEIDQHLPIFFEPGNAALECLTGNQRP